MDIKKTSADQRSPGAETVSRGNTEIEPADPLAIVTTDELLVDLEKF